MDPLNQDAISKSISTFEPVNTPFHVIAVVGIVVLVSLGGYEISNMPWNLITLLISCVILISIIFSLLKVQIVDDKYLKQLRYVRSVGIASAVLVFFIAGDDALQFPPLFYKLYAMSVVHIITFGVYLYIADRTIRQNEETTDTLKKKSIESNKKHSFLQLALITTALLIGIAKNAANGSRYYQKVDRVENIFYAPRIETLEKEIYGLSEETEANSLGENLNQIINYIQKEMIKKGGKSTLDSLTLKSNEVKLNELMDKQFHVLKYEDIVRRYRLLDDILFYGWFGCISIWMFFMLTNLSPKFVFNNNID